jgi:hypothetical protein
MRHLHSGSLRTILNLTQLSVTLAGGKAFGVDTYIRVRRERIAFIERRCGAACGITVFIAELAVAAFGLRVWQVRQAYCVAVLDAESIGRAARFTFFATFRVVRAEVDGTVAIRFLDILANVSRLGVCRHIFRCILCIIDVQFIDLLGVFRHVLIAFEVERQVCAGCECAAEKNYREGSKTHQTICLYRRGSTSLVLAEDDEIFWL